MFVQKYIIRPPLTDSEWNETRILLKRYRNEFDDATCFPSFEKELEHLEEIYNGNTIHLLIAIDKTTDSIIGCVGLHQLTEDIAEMRRLYVMPGHRRHQLGRLLTEKSIGLAEEKGYHHLYLDTMHEMKAAQQLYLALGFSVIDPYKNQDPAKLICYQKVLNQKL